MKKHFEKSSGFTVIELITVLAVLAILLAIILPALGGARGLFTKLETKARFGRWSLGLAAYRAEYGRYPQLGASPVAINEVPGRFVELMTGRGLEGGVASEPIAVAQNPKGLAFMEFAQGEVAPDGSLLDAAGGYEIEYLYDGDGDGFLDGVEGVRGKIGWRAGEVVSWK